MKISVIHDNIDYSVKLPEEATSIQVMDEFMEIMHYIFKYHRNGIIEWCKEYIKNNKKIVND